MKTFRNIAIITAVAATLAACQQVMLHKAGVATIDDTLTVETVQDWNKWPPENHREIWTLDGPDLQLLTFNTQIKEGENIYRKKGSDDHPYLKRLKNMPTFRKGMNALEVSELFIASYQQFGQVGVQVSGLRNERFAGQNGFYFELDFTDKEGLERRGIVQGTVQGDVMHVITYAAPKLHYFNRDRKRAERIIRSAKFLSAAGA